jgi:fumarate reductase subunit D
MNKKLNTLLFVLGATVINIILMIVLLLVAILILARVLPPDVNPAMGQLAFLGSFILSVVGSFFIYHRAMRIIAKRVELDKYFDPIFKPRRRR